MSAKLLAWQTDLFLFPYTFNSLYTTIKFILLQLNAWKSYLRLPPPPPRDGRDRILDDGLVDGRPIDGLFGLSGLAIGCVGLGGLVPGGLVPGGLVPGGLCVGGG
ncbi:hypothetical protein [Sulfurovum sp.]|uniref:hypothetical protein n=1 Tax=Sulfurovum sp. TaxID=1969726 RepID=UPI0035614145